MKHLLLYSDRGGVYGAEQINHRLALALHQAGFRVSVAQPEADNALVAERRMHSISHYWLADEDLYDWRHPARSLSDPLDAERCFAAIRPDLILFADSFPFAGLAAKQTAARQGIPYLVLIHCVQPDWAQQYRACGAALAGVFEAAFEVIAVSAENLALLRRAFGLPADRGRVIHNGRPEIFFAPRDAGERRRVRAALGIAPDRIVALSIGRFEWVKGYQYLLDALRTLRRCEHWAHLDLIWVGSGTLEGRLRRVARLLGEGRVHILSERPDVPALLDAADLLVHPARFEGMPLVVLEAMAKGLAIIASAVSGIPEALGDSGVLLSSPEEADFSDRLAAAICRLASDTKQRQVLGRAAHERALACFTESLMISRYLDLVRCALSES